MPYVPQSVLDTLLEIAKRPPCAHVSMATPLATTISAPLAFESRVGGATSHFVTGLQHQNTQTVTAAPVVGFAGEVPQASDDLPHDVSSAAVAFAYGNAAQVGVNREYARKALARGVHASDVVAALADGEEL